MVYLLIAWWYGKYHSWRKETGWWCNNHLEKYEFVNGKDYPIYFRTYNSCSKPPTRKLSQNWGMPQSYFGNDPLVESIFDSKLAPWGTQMWLNIGDLAETSVTLQTFGKKHVLTQSPSYKSPSGSTCFFWVTIQNCLDHHPNYWGK